MGIATFFIVQYAHSIRSLHWIYPVAFFHPGDCTPGRPVEGVVLFLSLLGLLGAYRSYKLPNAEKRVKTDAQ